MTMGRVAVRPGAVAALALALLHFAVALAVGERPLAAYFTLAYFSEIALFLLIPWIGWFLFTFLQAAREKAPSPIGYIVERMSAERSRFASAAIFLIAYALVNRSYRAIKVSIPRLNDFWADPLFVDWDRWLFGTDPWRITHAIFGPAATEFLDWAYFVWFVVVLLAFAFAAFIRDPRTQAQACLTYLLVWIVLGNIMALWLSSVGPCYYDDFFNNNHFASLMTRLQSHELAAMDIQSYLLSTTGDEAIGSGISAMPSVHCGLTMFVVLLVNRLAGGRWALLALAYHLAILVGSVHLGWHYAVDGIVSTALVPVIWCTVGRIPFRKSEKA